MVVTVKDEGSLVGRGFFRVGAHAVGKIEQAVEVRQFFLFQQPVYIGEHRPEVGTAEAPELETTVIDGSLYGDFRLDLLQQGNIIDTLKINVPRDDGFLIFENVLKDLTYGCEIISNMRDFAAEEYPDLIQLDFTILNEVEVPQYARFFAISDGKLVEIPVYENGVETAPYGTHLEPQYAGMMIQHIVAKEYGTYTVKQYEYTYDPDSLTINRKRVRYTGYN